MSEPDLTPAGRGFRIRGLGEVAIRCRDFQAMIVFYEEILGLPRLRGNENPDIVFFEIAVGFAGHTTVLALFRDLEFESSAGADSLHHLALCLPFEEQDAVQRWFLKHGIVHDVRRFDWIGWRGVFAQDPEGNTVELVAADPAHRVFPG